MVRSVLIVEQISSNSALVLSTPRFLWLYANSFGSKLNELQQKCEHKEKLLHNKAMKIQHRRRDEEEEKKERNPFRCCHQNHESVIIARASSVRLYITLGYDCDNTESFYKFSWLFCVARFFVEAIFQYCRHFCSLFLFENFVLVRRISMPMWKTYLLQCAFLLQVSMNDAEHRFHFRSGELFLSNEVLMGFYYTYLSSHQ